MQEELVSFETAKLAKEKGFQENVRNYFKIGMLSKGLIEEECISCEINFKFKDSFLWARPTQSFLQKWLREVHKIHITIQRVIGNKGTTIESESWTFEGSPWKTYPTYEECLEIALQEALKLI